MKRKEDNILQIEDQFSVQVEDNITIVQINCERLNLRITQQTLKERKKVQYGEKCILLTDIERVKSISKDSLTYLSGPKGIEGVKVCAVVVSNNLQKLIANFFISIKSPPVKMRTFTNRNKAIAWLKENE